MIKLRVVCHVRQLEADISMQMWANVKLEPTAQDVTLTQNQSAVAWGLGRRGNLLHVGIGLLGTVKYVKTQNSPTTEICGCICIIITCIGLYM